MSELVESFFADDVPQFCRTLQSLSERLEPDAVPRHNELHAELLQAIEMCLLACRRVEAELRTNVPELRKMQARFRDAIQPWFDTSPFMRHALAKPRGYAGDFEMLIGVYGRQARGLGLGGHLDLYFLDTVLGRAVPARLKGIRHFLRDEIARRGGDLTVLNIACGPGREYYEGVAVPDECHVTVLCLDHDDAALNFVRTQVAPCVAPNLELQCIKHNALRMMSGEANRRHFGAPDILYSVGLCDYIPDEIMIRLLRGWRETVADGGVVYVAFKDCLRYDTEPYQWLVDWHFFQRTEADCLRLFAHAGYPVDDLEMVRDDDLGSIMNFVYRVPLAAPLRRVDRALAGLEALAGAATEKVKFAPAE